MSAFKLYLNFSGVDDLPEYTYIYKSTSPCNETVQHVVARYCSAYNKKFRVNLSSESVQLAFESDKALEPGQQIARVTSSGSDVTVVLHNAGQTSSSAVCLQSSSSPAAACTAYQPASTHCSSPNLYAPAASTTSSGNAGAQICTSVEALQEQKVPCQSNSKKCSPVIKQFLEKAREAESKKYFRAACKIYEQAR